MFEFLPVGSTVELAHKYEKKLVVTIIGRAMRYNDSLYDYVGVLYPFGFLGDDSAFYFNNSDISKVIDHGLVTSEELEFSQALADEYLEVKKQK